MTTTPTAPTRQRLSPEQRRQRLLDIGLEVFGESAYDQLSAQDIARRAEISHGLLFHYFGSKRGFYVAVIREAADRLLERSQAALEATPDGVDATQFVQLDVFLGFVEDNSGLFTLLMQGGIGVDRQVQGIVDSTRKALARRVAPRQPSEDLSDLDRLALTAWIGAVEAAAVDWADQRRRGAETLDRHQLSELLHHMLPPTLRPGPSQEEPSP